MQDLLNFFIEIGKLKKMSRTGWVWLGIKNPETIGQHIFRVAVMNWILAQKVRPKLNLERIIKISLVHDLCEVFVGDMTPYWGLLPKDIKKRREVLKRWIRLPLKMKKKRDSVKFKKEKDSIQKLTKFLKPNLKKEIMNCWLEYERMVTREGKFVKQGDKVETLLQALEYWGSKPNTPVIGWWEEVEDMVDNQVLINFLDKIEKNFYGKKKADGELKFLLEIGKLKTMPRTGWVLRNVKNPETIAEHIFLLTIASWILGQKKRLNLEKLIKMSLVYEICEVYAGDTTPYDGIVPNNNAKKTLERWPRFLQKEKEKRFFKDYEKEREALKKIISELPISLKKEIFEFWDDCKKRQMPEGKFVNQVYWLVTYLQALQYFKQNRKFPILAWYEQMREFIDDQTLLELMEEMEKKFLPKKLFFDRAN